MSHTKGPWEQRRSAVYGPDDVIVAGTDTPARPVLECEANGYLIAAAPDLLEAADAQEKAELANANCDECEGEGAPELCPQCFPLFDDARVKRRLAIAKSRPVSGED